MQATIAQDLIVLAANPNLDITSFSFKTRLELRRAQATANPGGGKISTGNALASVISVAQNKHAVGPNSGE